MLWGGDVQREGCGIPLAYGELLLLPAEDSLIALNGATGEVSDSAELPENCSTAYSGALLGNTLLQPTEHGISLIDAEGLKLTASRQLDGELASDCAMTDSFGYFAIKLDSGYQYLCVDLSDSGLKTVWSMDIPDAPSAAAIQGDNIIFAAGSSIFTHDRKEDVSCEIPVGKEITGDPFATEYAVFFSTSDGNAGKLRLNTDGTLEEDTLSFCKVGGSPSTPLSWNGRLYVATADGLYILDNLNMETTYIVTDIKGGRTPQVHYGSGPYVYLVAPREDKWAVYCVLDMDDETEPTVSILALMEDYSSGAFCASPGGTLYFRDALGRVYALAIAPFDVLSLILRLVVLLALLALVFVWIKKVAKRRENLRPRY